MQSFEALSSVFTEQFNRDHFPARPSSLYDPNRYFLSLGGKRIRPVLTLMGNELFGELHPDAYKVSNAIELFHNFTLIHDDIMDKAPLRRGMATVHEKFGQSTALLAGDVMLVRAYEYLNQVDQKYAPVIINLFNRTAREVCEGQQLDMDFETRDDVSLEEYLSMINLKTSVLLAAALAMGAVLGGALEGNRNHLYEFGRKLGLAFQVQDDYLDAFGDPERFGKQVGGDILANKKTFLLIHALESATGAEKEKLQYWLKNDGPEKVAQVLEIYRNCGVDAWADALKEQYMNEAMDHLEAVAVLSSRKKSLVDLARFLVARAH